MSNNAYEFTRDQLEQLFERVVMAYVFHKQDQSPAAALELAMGDAFDTANCMTGGRFLTRYQEEELKALYAGGSGKIPAIKRLREMKPGTGLKEAKDFIEVMMGGVAPTPDSQMLKAKPSIWDDVPLRFEVGQEAWLRVRVEKVWPDGDCSIVYTGYDKLARHVCPDDMVVNPSELRPVQP